MIEQIEAELFHGFQTNGRSRPARMTCRKADGQPVNVFVKFAGGVTGHYFGLCAEVLCSAIARHLGLVTPDPYIVNLPLSPEFLAGVPAEAKDIVGRSLGLNFGTVAVGDGFTVVPPEPRLPTNLRPVAAEIFAFDILMQNFDRKWDNPNLLWNQKRIVLIDHESALHPVLSWPEPSVAMMSLEKFYDHVCYSPISPADANYDRLASVLGTLTPEILDGFFGLIPAVWRDESAMARVRGYLNFLVDNREPLCKHIKELIS
jgi:hypothetical protein